MSAVAERAFVEHDPAFAGVLGDAPALVRVVDVDAHEGPVYSPAEDALYFTSVPQVRDGRPRVDVMCLELDGERFPLDRARVSVVRADANVANGMALAADGRLIVCEQGSHLLPARIAALDPLTGEIETLADSWRGLPLNSPNDVVVKCDGTIWFTDPSYGHLQGFRPEPATGDHVYRLDPDGRLTVVEDSFDKPNGLAFSPDERTLYVADNGAPHHLRAFDVVGGRRLAGSRLVSVTTPGFPDGIATDAGGRLYVSSATGIEVLDAGGELLGEIVLPGTVNFCFGGRGRNVLFITTDSAIWAAVLAVEGA